jgi:hypothetical protein
MAGWRASDCCSAIRAGALSMQVVNDKMPIMIVLIQKGVMVRPLKWGGEFPIPLVKRKRLANSWSVRYPESGSPRMPRRTLSLLWKFRPTGRVSPLAIVTE